MSKKPEFIEYTKDIYEKIKPEIDKLRVFEDVKKDSISCKEVVSSAFIKCYDFMNYLCGINNYEHAFFQIPFLRSIVEDFISLSYLLEQDEVDFQSFIVTKRFVEINKTLKAQNNFFSEYNPNQIILPKDSMADVEDYLNYYNENGKALTKKALPRVWDMAEKTGLEDIYRFLFHATSKAVHFDVTTLLSMGWGKINEEKDSMDVVFSYKNNYHQYFKFVFFYTSYIFIHQANRFREYLNLSDELFDTLQPLISGYNKIDWPEIITFEQLNKKAPTSHQRKLYRAMKEIEKNEKSR